MPRTDNLYGRGSIVRRPTGLYQIGVPVGRRPDGRIAYIYRYTRDPKQAERLRAQLVRDRDRGRFAVLPARQTVGEYLDAWLARQTALPQSIEAYRVALARVRPMLGHIRLTDLTPAHIQDWQDAAAKSHAPRTVNQTRGRLRTALAEAVRLEYISRNPADGQRSLRTGPVEKHRPLSVEQARTLIAACAGHPFGAAYLAALYLGLRTGEILGLTWPAIDSEGRTLTVVQQLQRIENVPRLVPVKSQSGSRILPLPASLGAALARHRTATADRTVAREWADLVFVSARGNPVAPAVFRRSFAQLLADLGLPQRTPHALRSGTSSLLFALDIPDKLRAEILGHSDARVTNQFYTFTSSAQHRAALDRLDAYLQAQTDG